MNLLANWHVVRDVVIGFAALVVAALIAIGAAGAKDHDFYDEEDDYDLPIEAVAEQTRTEEAA